jgi:hypothetical protein
MVDAPSYRAIQERLHNSTTHVKWYFDQLHDLLEDGYPYEVSLAYLFLRSERAHNRALYCGAVKLHRASTELADRAVNSHHLSRDGFLTLYASVFGKPIKRTTRAKIEEAESVRDRVIHGKLVSDADMREAHIDVIEYAEALNEDIEEIAGFSPFGDLRGFKGRAEPLDNSTSRWLLKGLGFNIA